MPWLILIVLAAWSGNAIGRWMVRGRNISAQLEWVNALWILICLGILCWQANARSNLQIFYSGQGSTSIVVALGGQGLEFEAQRPGIATRIVGNWLPGNSTWWNILLGNVWRGVVGLPHSIGPTPMVNVWGFSLGWGTLEFLLGGFPGIAFLLLSAAKNPTPTAGICRACGYDLRATPTRCPECGTVVVTFK